MYCGLFVFDVSQHFKWYEYSLPRLKTKMNIVLLNMYEGESIIIRDVCFIFIKRRVEILQVHNFST